MAKKDEIDMSLDDLDLDMDIMGGEGDLASDPGGRKPTGITKEFFAGMINGVGEGTKKVASEEFRRKFPIASEVKGEIGQTFSEFNDLRKDLQQQMQPMLLSLEVSTQKLLPKAKKLIPTKIYDKISKKLDARAKARREEAGSPERSKEDIEQESITNELTEMFNTQAELQQSMQAENRQSTVLNQALEATRSHKLNVGLSHIYEATRGTELFHRTTHTAYMKKSLELKYKHLFVTKDVFNLMKQQAYMLEEYLKGITKNTGLPDMMKEKPLDYIYKERTQSFGTKLSEYTANFRKKLIENVKNKAMGVIQGGLSSAVSGLSSAADAADMAQGVPGMDGALKGAGANMLGSGLMSFIINNTIGGAGVRAITDKITPYTQDIDKTFSNFKTKGLMKLNQKRQQWAAGGGGIFGNMLAGIAGMLPGMEAATTGANDLLTRGEEGATFDRMTRQSIVEIIPGFLGKILQSVDAVRTGTMDEETVYDVRTRGFVSVSRMKEVAAESMYGDENIRSQLLGKSLGALRAGYGTTHSRKDTEKAFKGMEKEIHRVLLNHAINVAWIDPVEIGKYVATGKTNTYIDNITSKVENPREVLNIIWKAITTKDGEIDGSVVKELETSIAQIFDNDAYKSELPKMFEVWGQRRFFADKFTKVERSRLQRAADAGNEKAKALLQEGEGLIQAGTNKINMHQLASGAIDMDYSDVEKLAREESMQVGDRLKHSSDLRSHATNVLGGLSEKGAGFLVKGVDKIRRFAGRFGQEHDGLESLSERLHGVTSDNATDKIRKFASKHGFTTGNVSDWNSKNIGIDKNVIDNVTAIERAMKEREAFLTSPARYKTPEGRAFKKFVAKWGLRAALEEDPEYKALSEQLQAAKDQYDTAVQTRDNSYIAAEKASSSHAADSVFDRLKTLKDRSVGTATSAAGSVKYGATQFAEGLDDISSSSKLGDLISGFQKSVEEGFSKLIGLKSDTSATDASSESTVEPTGDPMLDEFRNWREEYTSVSGTIFDAIMYVAENGGGGGGGKGKKRSKWDIRNLGNIAKSNIFKAGKWTANAYVKTYSTVLKGGMSAAGYVGKGLLNAFGASPYLDIYVKGEIGPKPLVTWKQQAYNPGIVFADDGKRVGSSKEIDRPCIDPRTGNIVITEEDLKKGLVTISNNPIGSAFKMAVLGAGRAANTIAKGYFGIYGKVIGAVGGIMKKVAGGLFGDKKDQFFDVYLKDKVEPGKPILTARQQEEGVYFSGQTRVIRTSEITKPVFGRSAGGRPKCLITEDDIKHGLVDIENRPITKGGSSGILSNLTGIGRDLMGVLGKGALKTGDLYAHIYKGLFDLGKKGVMGAGKLGGKMFSKLFGLGGGMGDEETVKPILDRMDKMIVLLTKIADNIFSKKKPGDKDGDGIIDGSYEDQMKNKASAGTVDKDGKSLDELHKDVDHADKEEGKEGEGDGSLSSKLKNSWLGKGANYLFRKTKWGRKINAFTKVFGRKAKRWGGKMLGKMGGSLGKLAGKFGGKALGIGGSLLGGAGALLGLGGKGRGRDADEDEYDDDEEEDSLLESATDLLPGKGGGMMSKAGSLLKSGAGKTGTFLKGMGGKAGTLLKGFGGKAGGLLGKAGGLLGKTGGFLGKAAGGIGKALPGLLGKGAGLIGKAGGMLGGLLPGVAGAAGGAAGAAGAGAGALGGAAGLLGGAAKFLGPVGLGIAAAKGLYDSYQGWNNASEIMGKDEGDLNFNDKGSAAAGSALSGLTFGLMPKSWGANIAKYTGLGAATGIVGSGISGIGRGIKGMFGGSTDGLTDEERASLQERANMGDEDAKKQLAAAKGGIIQQGVANALKYSPIGLAMMGSRALGKGLGSAAKGAWGGIKTLFGGSADGLSDEERKDLEERAAEGDEDAKKRLAEARGGFIQRGVSKMIEYSPIGLAGKASRAVSGWLGKKMGFKDDMTPEEKADLEARAAEGDEDAAAELKRRSGGFWKGVGNMVTGKAAWNVAKGISGGLMSAGKKAGSVLSGIGSFFGLGSKKSSKDPTMMTAKERFESFKELYSSSGREKLDKKLLAQYGVDFPDDPDDWNMAYKSLEMKANSPEASEEEKIEDAGKIDNITETDLFYENKFGDQFNKSKSDDYDGWRERLKNAGVISGEALDSVDAINEDTFDEDTKKPGNPILDRLDTIISILREGVSGVSSSQSESGETESGQTTRKGSLVSAGLSALVPGFGLAKMLKSKFASRSQTANAKLATAVGAGSGESKSPTSFKYSVNGQSIEIPASVISDLLKQYKEADDFDGYVSALESWISDNTELSSRHRKSAAKATAEKTWEEAEMWNQRASQEKGGSSEEGDESPNFLKHVKNDITGGIKSGWESLKKYGKDVKVGANAMGIEAYEGGKAWLKDKAKGAWAGAGKLADKAKGMIGNAWGSLKDKAGGALGAIKDKAGKYIGWGKDQLNDIYQDKKAKVLAKYDQLKGKATDIFNDWTGKDIAEGGDAALDKFYQDRAVELNPIESGDGKLMRGFKHATNFAANALDIKSHMRGAGAAVRMLDDTTNIHADAKKRGAAADSALAAVNAKRQKELNDIVQYGKGPLTRQAYRDMKQAEADKELGDVLDATKDPTKLGMAKWFDANNIKSIGAVSPGEKKDAQPAPTSTTDVLASSTKATSAAVAKASTQTLAQSSDLSTAFNQMLKQNQQLITMLSAVMTANGVKIDGMEALQEGVNKPMPTPQVINTTNVTNNASTVTADTDGFDMRKT